MDNKNIEEEEIVFHDETSQKKDVTGPENLNHVREKNNLGIISLVLAIVYAIIAVIPSNSNVLGFVLVIFQLVSFAFAVVALVQIKNKKQNGKIFPILTIVIIVLVNIISTIYSIVVVGDMIKNNPDGFECLYASECVDNGDGTSTCISELDESEITCSTDHLLK